MTLSIDISMVEGRSDLGWSSNVGDSDRKEALGSTRMMLIELAH